MRAHRSSTSHEVAARGGDAVRERRRSTRNNAFYGYLSRRGFGSDVVHTVLEEVLGRPD